MVLKSPFSFVFSHLAFCLCPLCPTAKHMKSYDQSAVDAEHERLAKCEPTRNVQWNQRHPPLRPLHRLPRIEAGWNQATDRRFAPVARARNSPAVSC